MPPELPPGLVPEGAPTWFTMLVAGVWGSLWVLDKVAFYVSKIRNKEKISSPRAMVDRKKLESIEKSIGELAGSLKQAATNSDELHGRYDAKLLEIAYAIKEVRNSSDRIERRLDGLKQKD